MPKPQGMTVEEAFDKVLELARKGIGASNTPELDLVAILVVEEVKKREVIRWILECT